MCGEIIDNHEYVPISFDFVEDDSYTVSYSLTGNPETEGWVSFHDYVCDYSINLRDQSLLQFYNGQLYEMNEGARGLFFGILYPSVITPVFISLFRDKEIIYPFIVEHLNWNCDVEDIAKRLLNETWSSISLHNSFQGTRQLPLKPFDSDCSLLEQYGTFNTKRVKNRWVYNYAFNEKLSQFERTWIELRDKFLVVNIEDKKCIQEELYKTRMFDDFVIARLVFENTLNKKLFQYDINLTMKATSQ